MIEAGAPLVELVTMVGQALMQHQDRAAARVHAPRPSPPVGGLAHERLEPEHLAVSADTAVVISDRQGDMGEAVNTGHTAHSRDQGASK